MSGLLVLGLTAAIVATVATVADLLREWARRDHFDSRESKRERL